MDPWSVISESQAPTSHLARLIPWIGRGICFNRSCGIKFPQIRNLSEKSTITQQILWYLNVFSLFQLFRGCLRHKISCHQNAEAPSRTTPKKLPHEWETSLASVFIRIVSFIVNHRAPCGWQCCICSVPVAYLPMRGVGGAESWAAFFAIARLNVH